MFNIFEFISKRLKDILSNIVDSETPQVVLQSIGLETVPDNIFKEFDMATNIAMLAAKTMKLKPIELAEKIAHQLEKEFWITKVEAVGAGFVNIKFTSDFYKSTISNIIKDDKFGFSNIGNNEKINIEYVSANPTGPLHIGHARGAIVGDVIASMLQQSGFSVTREYYINDSGGQINTLLQSALIRYKQVILNDQSIQIPEGCYPGDYLIPVGIKLTQEYGTSLLEIPENDAINTIRPFVLNEMIQLIKATLKRMNINHDIFTSEQSIVNSKDMNDAISILRNSGLTYHGTIEKPKGQTKVGWEERQQELFKSTLFGDDSDRALTKSDGSYAYFAPDIAYHYNKFKRGFKKMVLVLGADHKGYVKRIKAAVQAISNNTSTIDVKLCELVHFIKNEERQKSSKRSGKFLTIDDVIDEIDPSIIRFIILTKKNDTILNFDLQKSLEQSKENPVFYVQYAYSRCCSLIRSFVENFGILPDFKTDKQDFSTINFSNEAIRKLLILINSYPRVILTATKTLQPHLIVTHVIEVARVFHSLWSEKKIKFIDKKDRKSSEDAIAIALITQKVIKSSLRIIGVEAPEKM